MKLIDNNNIFCSVSAGYSSVMMAIRMKKMYPNHNIINVMSNTSKERRESLVFMNECDRYFGLNLIWIEAEICQTKGKGTDFKVVEFEDLKTEGELFEDGIKKYGIPSSINKWCNRELKLNPLRKHANSIFGRNNYSIAVGIRSDEIDRISKDYKKNNVFYPLIESEITTEDRNKFWSNSSFVQIKIPAFKGNCDMCFEKSNRKLKTILIQNPKCGNWWQSMIDKYGKIPLPNKPAYNDLMKENNGMTFFRGYNNINNLEIMSKEPFNLATDEYIYEDDSDIEDECGSGCTVF